MATFSLPKLSSFSRKGDNYCATSFFLLPLSIQILKRYGRAFAKEDKTFNAGVYGVNFDLWRQQHIHEDVLYWLDQVTKQI